MKSPQMQSLYVEKCSITENGTMMTLSPDSRSVSPMTPSPSREIKGLRLFRAISRKLGRRSQESITNEIETESRSSSTDSCSSTSVGHCSRKLDRNSSGDSGFRSLSHKHISGSSSDAESDIPAGKHKHQHSSSAESIKKIFQSLTMNTQRSRSCSSPKEHKRKNKKPTKRILRTPVTYTYVRGLSGLPTQRIPMNQARMYFNNSCSCGVSYTLGLR